MPQPRDDTGAADPHAPSAERQGNGTVFVVLVLMGLATFAPCILLPEWRRLEAVEFAARKAEHKLDGLRVEVDRQQRLLDAICKDSATVGRLARRELGYRSPGAYTVRVSAMPDAARPPERLLVPQAPAPPVALARIAGWLPDYDYDRVFCDNEVRPIIMAMSIGLILTAFALFRPKVPGAYQDA